MDEMKEMPRHSVMHIRISTFGTSAQSDRSVTKVLSMLKSAHFDVELLDVEPYEW